MTALLRALLHDAPAGESCADLGVFWAAHAARTAAIAAPFDRAVLGGFHADRAAGAFAAGYVAALQALVPALPRDRVVCLCATEEGGVHPRAIATALRADGEGRYRLTGRKQFVTGGMDAAELLVVVSAGTDAGGRNRLRVARVAAGAAGVALEAREPAPFAPELRHAIVRLEEVLVAEDDLLPGDGYEGYLKPFRTIEDLHVLGALAGHVLAVARPRADAEPEAGARAVVEELCAVLVALGALAAAPAGAAEVHVALAGVFARAGAWLDPEGEAWTGASAAARARWRRDAPLAEVAGSARRQRAAAAWRRLGEAR